MNQELMQGILQVVFKGHLLYIAPFLFLMMGLLFANNLVNLIKDSISRRRSNY